MKFPSHLNCDAEIVSEMSSSVLKLMEKYDKHHAAEMVPKGNYFTAMGTVIYIDTMPWRNVYHALKIVTELII